MVIVLFIFSLFRGSDLPSAQGRFFFLKDKLPLFSEIDPACPSIATQAGLQQLGDAIRANPSRTPLHIAVQLDMRTVVASPRILP